MQDKTRVSVTGCSRQLMRGWGHLPTHAVRVLSVAGTNEEALSRHSR